MNKPNMFHLKNPSIIKLSLFYNIPVHETVKFLYTCTSIYLALCNFKLTKEEGQMYSSFW